MKTTLVIMAAGLGSRYGGDKQIDGVGPNHEILMEYSIYDAIRAGFNKIVFIIKPEMEELIRRVCGDYLEKKSARDGIQLEVAYAFQDFTSIPLFYHIPSERTKPFGTVHALLCAKEVVHEPFCVINADDYYGIDAYQTAYDALQNLPQSGRAAMVGYLLKNTASLNGGVTRGICTVEDGMLRRVKETSNIQLYSDGHLESTADKEILNPNAIVSMNFWCFMPSIFSMMQAYFEDFLRNRIGSDIKMECLLPTMVDDFMKQHRLEVSVLHSADKWFGMTYKEDRVFVAEKLKELHRQGVYPDLRKILQFPTNFPQIR